MLSDDDRERLAELRAYRDDYHNDDPKNKRPGKTWAMWANPEDVEDIADLESREAAEIHLSRPEDTTT
jgi:hypothetical protein